MRGGVFRAGTYPPKEFGLQWQLLHDFSEIARRRGLKVLVEPMDIRLLDAVDPFVDGFQVGARQMQNYALLEALSGTDKLVTLKRNMGATLDEFLGAAEYLLGHSRYTPKVHLVERGSSSFMNHVRWDLSVSTIAAVKTLTGLPVLVDASHGTGRRDLVEPLTLAGVAAGADGFIVEVHPEPEKSLSDADQAFPLQDLPALLRKARRVKSAAEDYDPRDEATIRAYALEMASSDQIIGLRDAQSCPPCEDGRAFRGEA